MVYDPSDDDEYLALINDIELPVFNNKNYTALSGILVEAYKQASEGKGKERHVHREEPFDEQLICILERLGLTFCEGQAVKKIIEAHFTGNIVDLLGAINYISAAIIVKREQANEKS